MERLSWTLSDFASLVESSPDCVTLSDFDSQLRYINPAGLAMVGLHSLDDVRGLTTGDLLTPAAFAKGPEVEAALKSIGAWSGESELRHCVLGTAIPVSASLFAFAGANGSEVLIASVQRDLRERKDHERQLRDALDAASYRLAEQRAIARLSQLALHGDLDELLTAATDAAATLMSVQCSSIARPNPSEDTMTILAFTGGGPSPNRIPAGRLSQPGHAFDTNSDVVCVDSATETRFRTETMAARNLRSGVSVPIIGDGGPWGVLNVHSSAPCDYTEQDVSFLRTVAGVLSAAIRRVELEAQLRHQSLHDPLTGLPNRVLAYDRLERVLSTGSPGTLTAVMLIDLDDFKTINDTFGHETGDAALTALARHLNSAVRPGDMIARLGGDEFIAICENLSEVSDILEIAESLAAVLRLPIEVGERTLLSSASIGISLTDSPSTISGSEMIRRADVAMYQAKTAGPGTYRLFETDAARYGPPVLDQPRTLTRHAV